MPVLATAERICPTPDDYPIEVLVIDDGSTDGTGEKLRGLSDIRLIQFTQNHGSGTARKFGTSAARGRVTVWTDVDITYPNDQIPQLVKELEVPRAYFTHISHQLGLHEEVSKELPPGIELAYDGLQISI